MAGEAQAGRKVERGTEETFPRFDGVRNANFATAVQCDGQTTLCEDLKRLLRPWFFPPRPFRATAEVHLRAGWEPIEFICNENNKDVEHLPGNANIF